MRRSLAGIAIAVTSLVAVAFLVPLAIVVGQSARERALTDAFRNASAIGPVLALTTDRAEVEAVVASTPAGALGRMTVHLPEDGDGTDTATIGPALAGAAEIRRARREGRSFTTPVPGGVAVLQPIVLDNQRLAVVEVAVPQADLVRGVARSRAVLILVALALVLGSVLFADRLAARVVRAARDLSTASGRLGSGDLTVRIAPHGPAELRDAAVAFNTMADRVVGLLATEREMAADLSHRLRTPLAGLLLASRGLGDVPAAQQVRDAGSRLQEEVDRIIHDVRRTPQWRPAGCDAIEVLRRRLEFWGALAEDEGRTWGLHAPEGPVALPVAADDLGAAVDALLGNVFMHTPAGTPFAVTVVEATGTVNILITDEGPGLTDPESAVHRGASGAGSTGLGLDIARRLCESTGGRLRVGNTATGGAEIDLLVRVAPPLPAPFGRLRRGRARTGRRSRRTTAER